MEEAGLVFPTKGTRPYTMACVAGPEGQDRVDEDGVALDARNGVVFCSGALHMGCSVLGRGAEPPQFWVLLIWLEPGISHVTWVHYDATMCLPCFVCSILPVLHFLRFDLCVL